MSKGFRTTIKSLNPEVTGSCIMLKIKRPGEPFERIIIDKGGFQEPAYMHLNEVLDFEPSELSCILVTHNHYDHIARIPFLVKNGFHREIYCTPVCKQSIPIALKDCLKIMQSDYDKYGKEMLYQQKEVDETETLLRGIEYNLPTHISKGVKLTFLGNGHLYGAASILLQISCKKYKDKNILITGDYYPKNELFSVIEIPEWVKKLEDLTIIQESTYGNTNQTEIEPCLEDSILSSIHRHQNLLMPVTAQERLEQVLLVLKNLQVEQSLSTKVKIFIHTELGKAYLNHIYLNNKNIVDFMPKNVEIIAKGDYKTALTYPGQKIILSSSGMADCGSVRFYLKNILSNNNYTIIFTCYTPKGTLAYKLRHATKEEYIQIEDKRLPLLCAVKHSSKLSHHARLKDVIQFLQQFENVKNILLTHGEIKARKALHTKLQEYYPNKNIFVMSRETGFKLDPEMEISTYPTNLSCEVTKFPLSTSLTKRTNPKQKKKQVKTRKRHYHS